MSSHENPHYNADYQHAEAVVNAVTDSIAAQLVQDAEALTLDQNNREVRNIINQAEATTYDTGVTIPREVLEQANGIAAYDVEVTQTGEHSDEEPIDDEDVTRAAELILAKDSYDRTYGSLDQNALKYRLTKAETAEERQAIEAEMANQTSNFQAEIDRKIGSFAMDGSHLQESMTAEITQLPEGYRFEDMSDVPTAEIQKLFREIPEFDVPDHYMENRAQRVLDSADDTDITAEELDFLDVGVRSPEGKLIGFATVVHAGTEGIMCDLAVHPDHRSKNIAKAMIDERIHLSDEAGVALLAVDYLSESNSLATYYIQRGFTPVSGDPKDGLERLSPKNMDD